VPCRIPAGTSNVLCPETSALPDVCRATPMPDQRCRISPRERVKRSKMMLIVPITSSAVGRSRQGSRFTDRRSARIRRRLFIGPNGPAIRGRSFGHRGVLAGRSHRHASTVDPRSRRAATPTFTNGAFRSSTGGETSPLLKSHTQPHEGRSLPANLRHPLQTLSRSPFRPMPSLPGTQHFWQR
jgi:hypothetical protein